MMQRIRMTLAAVLVAPAVAFLPGSPAAAADLYYVSPSGSDLTGDGTEGNPWATTDPYCDAVPTAAVATTIRFRAGTYVDPPRVTCGGTASARLTLEPMPGEQAVIKANQDIGVFLKGDYVTLRGFEVVGNAQTITYEQALAGWWTTPEGLDTKGVVMDAAGLVVEDMVIHDLPGNGIGTTKRAAGAVIQDNIIYNTAWWSTKGTHGIVVKDIDALAGFDTVVVRRNVVLRSESRLISHVFSKKKVEMEIDEGGAMIVQINAGTFDGEYDVSENLFLHNGKGAGMKSPHITFARNTMYGGGTTIGATGVAIRGQGATDLVVADNAVEARPGLNAVEMDPDTEITSCDGNLIEGGFKLGTECQGGTNVLDAGIFTDPVGGDFSLADGRTGHGVPPALLADMVARLRGLGVPLQPTGWCEDLAPQIEEIIANRPLPSTVDRSDPSEIVVTFPDDTNVTGEQVLTLAVDDNPNKPERVKTCGLQQGRYYRGVIPGVRVTGFEASANPLGTQIASAGLDVSGAAQSDASHPYAFDIVTPPGQGTLDVVGSMTNSAAQTETSSTFTIGYDNLSPSLAVTSGPGRPAYSKQPRVFTFAAADPRGVTVRCALDGAAYGPCTSATSHTVRTRRSGTHTFRVRATDSLGNATERSVPFTILPRVKAGAKLSVVRTPKGQRINALSLVKRPRDARAVLKCTGCGSAPKSLVGRTFRPGAVVRIVVTKEGHLGRVLRFTFRPGGPPLLTKQCRPPGRSTVVSCA